MELNLGNLIDVEIKKIKNPTKSTLAQVKWVFEKGELKFGTISKSKNGGLWVQLPKFPVRQNGWITPLKISDDGLERYLFEESLRKYDEIEDEDITPEEIESLMQR